MIGLGKKEKKAIALGQPSQTKITKCAMADCVYNIGRLCRAKYIYVGDDHQKCDDYSIAGHKIEDNSIIGYVGSCLVKKCAFNKDELCKAASITIARHKDHADCGMFKEV